MICICLLTKVSSARNKELGFVFPWKILQQWQDSARSFARWNLQITQLNTSQKKEWESTVRSCMEELDEIPELHHYSGKLVLQETLFPWSLTSSKVMLLLPICSCHSALPLRGRERITHGGISKKWLDFEKILENFGRFPGKGILSIHYCKFCHHGGKRLGYPGVKLLRYTPQTFSLAPASITNFLHGPY